MSTHRSGLLLLAAFFLAATASHGQRLGAIERGSFAPCADTPLFENVFFTGSVQHVPLPPGASEIVLVAFGAPGGDISTTGIGVGRGGAGIADGGEGAKVAARFPVQGVQSLTFLVGQRGANGTEDEDGAGGGGGTFIWNTATEDLLLAAGGGGGAGVDADGLDAALFTDGVDGGGDDGGLGGTGGHGGGAASLPPRGAARFAGGGGGWLSAGENGDPGGSGGGRVSPPGSAAGGEGFGGTGGAGGFGAGGAGSATGGGGGGGYDGGGGGHGLGTGGGGGGSSYVAPSGLPEPISPSGGTLDGYALLCVTETSSPVAVPAGGHGGRLVLFILLAGLGWTLLRRSMV